MATLVSRFSGKDRATSLFVTRYSEREKRNDRVSKSYHENEEMNHELRIETQNHTDQRCPLCHKTDLYHFSRIRERDYLSCRTCRLIFIPAEQHISADEEKSRYDQHNNNPDDPDYRTFLSRMFLPMQHRLNARSCGLDFGSGPGPTLSLMFEEGGHRRP
jgi:hypothetical protein